ncbi:unnamed protein product [Rotaria sordida]|uniref:AN1-type domain-containing protein n=1 Tax=Rotaria sordida TaxID=392033 RepID=A0A815MM02_9BILA|nr:unnamed protein product [Rotaria sordida]CAF1486717.1 unnamed protein product [Rotaria sordida]CAF4017750.1 unnamed protein product [Rotaria sordida]CAF4051058.1 unnamed protein product [Rotaria sordida]
MSIKFPCVKCELTDNFNGLFTCNGCRQSFCANHSIDHTNKLRNRFEDFINEFTLINDIFHDYKQNSNDFPWKKQKQEKEINEIKLQKT